MDFFRFVVSSMVGTTAALTVFTILWVGLPSCFSMHSAGYSAVVTSPSIAQPPMPTPESAAPSEPSKEDSPPPNQAVKEPVTVAMNTPPRNFVGDLLDVDGWNTHVGDGLGIWVSVGKQRLYVIENRCIQWEVPCSTAAAGVGAEAGSDKTPLGWHVVSEKIGDGAPFGQIFRSRRPTSEIWRPGQETKEDLVLTRILWLDGLEPGKNQGRNAQGISVDSKSRCIYIHGTNDEMRIGTPTSHGCIRLRNGDVIHLYDIVPVGTKVLITDP